MTDDPTELDDPVAVCPECETTNVWNRERKTPRFRCQNGHTSDAVAFVEARRRYGMGRDLFVSPTATLSMEDYQP